MIVVSDTSPLNYLILVGCADVLPHVFRGTFAPAAVVAELSHPRSPESVRTWAASPPAWLTIQDPSQSNASLNLGPGETAAIALAEELGADGLLIDERDGRDVAQQRGLAVFGTLAVLDRAAELDLIDLSEVIGRLKGTNFRVAEDLLQDVLRLDQERKRARAHGPQGQP